MMGLYSMLALRTAAKPRMSLGTQWVLDMLAMMGAAAGGRLPQGVGEPQMSLKNEFQRNQFQNYVEVEK
jgi:hypothetical protein